MKADVKKLLGGVVGEIEKKQYIGNATKGIASPPAPRVLPYVNSTLCAKSKTLASAVWSA